jgi:predicted acetyltransferase
VFLEILKYFRITQAFVSSYDPVFHYVATKYKQASTVNALLYQESDYVTIENPIERSVITVAEEQELETILTYHYENNMSGDWVKPYVENLVDREEMLLLKLDDQIIGTGEYRVSKSSPHISNIGMTVALKHRRKGLGTYILNEVKNHCNYKGYETICGTDAENIASQKTIMKCGFKCYHKIYNIWF